MTQMTDVESIRSVIAKLAALPAPRPADAERLRTQFGSERLSELILIARLQKKACLKFGPGVWWVTEKSLQQATPWQIAKLKSQWLGDAKAYDLCCGIGGDAMQLALRASGTCQLVAVDSDPRVIEYADANLQFITAKTLDNTGAAERTTTVCADARSIAIEAGASLHVDPDRRAGGKRTTRPEDYQPQLDDVMAMVGKASSAIIKLAPAAILPEPIQRSGHRCWMSLSGSVREQTVLLGESTERAGQQVGTVSAAVGRRDGAFSIFSADSQMLNAKAKPANAPMAFLVDPDAAIRAAGLTETFAETYSLRTLGGSAGFLTGDADFLTGDSGTLTEKMANIGQIAWAGSCDHRKLRKEFRKRNWYPETIKVRGTDHDPAKWVKQFRQCGETPVTLWIGRTGQRVFAAVSVKSAPAKQRIG
ncbi:hypothetical protein CA13_13280 [Planctomycetes bacterium CA13]|uniref:THUMP-like domain-containing protein n=1 Tax=Novipirellula herctigrandis TaxID=2527986 RepID=A0A5C5YXV9_9BACT|nr:hypothetical protein CA13_13280 [Planctomycetes bacterium CA13]